jgi:hypothetical protein
MEDDAFTEKIAILRVRPNKKNLQKRSGRSGKEISWELNGM